MRRNQKGEVMLVMMAVMFVVIWLGTGHMGMMGNGSGHAEGSAGTMQQAKTEQTESPAPSGPDEHQR